ncbi:uncharacterized protein LOC127255853 [Andrographis paniculata]|uniref:uncharacterized protein LOC127255853 n=1 Tax=Andrographis paniculata TaxID=175694 RepID=UPI0021E8F9E7|nr:uncharacterized protein LOC127255853 [Andrographis paniculata]
MSNLYAAVHYWLVDHPSISQYEWKPGQTVGSSPLFLAGAVVGYLVLTLSLRNSRHLPTLPAAALAVAAAAHNVILCLLSLVMVIGCGLATAHQMQENGGVTWLLCFPAGSTPPRGPIFFWGYVFYLSKLLEFADTALILLSRSRNRRLSFLHVYHHAVVLVMCYLWVATSQSMFPIGVVTNGSVHVVMYCYYLMTAVGLRPRWKRRLTDCQIGQFLFGKVISPVMLYLHFTNGAGGCSGFWTWGFSSVFAVSLFALFLDFRFRAYPGGGAAKIAANKTI